ncbi:hypothetical protein WBG78_06795 [Chryseolinea sp. T2]|uniref:hypothetical protein n=1 Tax=Chryseolinea sp. T2 TaxID=3129255 RepID=UPI0030784DC7
MSLQITLLFVAGLLASMPVNAQKPMKSVSLEDEVTGVAIDRPGDLYASLRNGKMFRVDTDGNILLLPVAKGKPTLFDPRDGSRLFAYYREEQHYVYFSSSRELSSYPVDSAFAISPWLICPSGDYNVWIADAADNVIRKINSATSRIDAEIKFSPGVADIKYMREYQGFLFVLHPSRGIVIFSSMGKELRTIGSGSIQYFNFLGEELYYPEGAGQLSFFNLFNTETRSVKLMRQASFSLLTDTRLFSVNGNRVEIFQAPR